MTISAQRTLTPNQRARRARILEAASELVTHKGYDGMIMRDVATLAQVSPTTLYNLYNTKDDLLLAALQEKITEGWGRADAIEPDLGYPRIMEQIRQSLRQTTENPEYARAITQALFRANQGDQILSVLFNGTEYAIRASLRAMQRAGELNEVCIDWLAASLVRAFWSNYFAWTTGALSLDALRMETERSFLLHFAASTQGELHTQIMQNLREMLGADC